MTRLQAAGGSGGSSGSGATGGSGGASGSGGSSGSGATGGSGGVSGSGGNAGAAGAPSCVETHDSFGFEIDNSDGSIVKCSPDATGTSSVTGRVVNPQSNEFVLDTCPPNARCAPSQTAVKIVQAPAGFALGLPGGAFVQVTYDVQMPWGCVARLLVKNVASWAGLPNPITQAPILWLAANDGSIEPLNGTGVTVTKQALGCISNTPDCGGSPPDDYRLLFGVNPAAPIAVDMGQNIMVVHHGVGFDEDWTVQNLRSYVGGACDEGGNWAWLIQGVSFALQGT